MGCHEANRRAFLLCLPACSLVASGAAPARASDIGAFVFGDPTATGCNSGDYDLPVDTITTEAGQYGIRTFVDVGGTRYMDDASTVPFDVHDTDSWSLFDQNSGGTATGVWPIPDGTAMDITALMRGPDGKALWETRLRVESCSSANVLARSNGPIHQLAQNPGFERAKAKRALAWKGGKRECTTSVSRVPRTGDCSLVLKGKAKARQLYATEPIAEAGDQLRLSAFMAATELGDGTTLAMTVRFPTLEPVTVSVAVPPGDYDYQPVATPPLNVGETPPDVSILIQKAAGGTLEIDDVELLSVANAAPAK